MTRYLVDNCDGSYTCVVMDAPATKGDPVMITKSELCTSGPKVFQGPFLAVFRPTVECLPFENTCLRIYRPQLPHPPGCRCGVCRENA